MVGLVINTIHAYPCTTECSHVVLRKRADNPKLKVKDFQIPKEKNGKGEFIKI